MKQKASPVEIVLRFVSTFFPFFFSQRGVRRIRSISGHVEQTGGETRLTNCKINRVGFRPVRISSIISFFSPPIKLERATSPRRLMISSRPTSERLEPYALIATSSLLEKKEREREKGKRRKEERLGRVETVCSFAGVKTASFFVPYAR